jgi:transposase InsO family protein
MDLKAEFVARLKRGERMAELCREFGINRQTGYEVLRRFEANGIEGLLPRSRAPMRIPHKTCEELAEALVRARKAHPTWGPKKLKAVLEARLERKMPAVSTILGILKRRGLVEGRRRRPKVPPHSRPLREARSPNEVWCVDYKGQFRLGDSSYCYPLTWTDQYSRYLLGCEAMPAIDQDAAYQASADVFRRHGLPEVIRSDNGVPFASRGLAALTRLSVFWLRLGIELERIEPGHPEQNGRHERMHRTLKLETTRPAGANLLQQQERFDRFLQEYNCDRPHEALGQTPPAKTHTPSARPFPEKLLVPRYLLHDDVLPVFSSGHISFPRGEKYFLALALADQEVAVREEPDGRWLVTFMQLDLGVIDRKAKTFTAVPAPALLGSN